MRHGVDSSYYTGCFFFLEDLKDSFFIVEIFARSIGVGAVCWLSDSKRSCRRTMVCTVLWKACLIASISARRALFIDPFIPKPSLSKQDSTRRFSERALHRFCALVPH